MSHQFAEIMFTDSVKAAQQDYGSRTRLERFMEMSGPNGISADPLFLDAVKGTFYLSEDSPAIGRGSMEYAPKQDFFNRPLIKDTAPDLGCFPFDPALLQPEARRDWYCQWPFLFRVQPDDILPDFWTLPE